MMLKSDLIYRLTNHLAEKYPKATTDKVIAESTHELLQHIAETLAGGGRLEIRGFGSLSCQYRPTQTARNPKTGEMVEAPDRYRVRFKMSKKLRLRLNSSY